MATHTHSALPSFSDVLHDFGFQLATVREPRLTQAQLANAINKLANKALLDAEFEYDERKEALDARLKDATAALADSQSVGTVDGKLVKEWERGRQFPTDAQYKHIKLAFKELAPLTQEEEEKLDNAFRSGKTVAKKGQNTETFGDTFDEILSKRMNEMKPPAVGSYNDFADMIMLVSDEKETDKLRADVEAAQKAIEELKPLKDETIKALVARAPKPREMMELTRKYNELVETIREDIAHSEAGRDLSDSLDAFKTTLSRSKGHTFDDIKYMNSKTGVSPANFEDYYTHGGLHMSEAPDMEEVLESVNAHWKTGNGGRNVLKHDEHSWKGEARTYISAHQRVRAEYESLSRAFESAMTTQLDKVRHNTALREQAEEYALLDARHQMQQQYPQDMDLRMGSIDLARHRELDQRFRDEPEFAEAVGRVRENHSFMDAARDRKNATGTGTPG